MQKNIINHNKIYIIIFIIILKKKYLKKVFFLSNLLEIWNNKVLEKFEIYYLK